MAKVRLNAKNVIVYIIVFALLIGILAICINVLGSDRKSISSFSFTSGAIDSNGNYRQSDTSICTSKMFECQGLLINRVFNSNSSYQIFYYREDTSYIGCTQLLNGIEYDKAETFENAKYANIVITPLLEEKEKVTFWNLLGFLNDFDIKVYKDQTFEAPVVSLFEGVKENYSTPVSGTEYCAVRRADAPFVLADINAFSNKRVKSISIPICGVVDANQDSVFTVSVVEGNGTSNFKKISTHRFVIPAGTFASSSGDIDPYNNEVADGKNVSWFEFNLDVTLKANQTLAFGSPTDSAYFVYRKGFTDSTNHYDIYNTAYNTPSLLKELGIYVDIKVLM